MRKDDSLAGEEEKDTTAGEDAGGEAMATAARGAETANLVEEKAKVKPAQTDAGTERQKS